MSPFGINPSKLLTELLSKYLQFDPEQLKLGIWSGDLSMKNVSLRKDTINALLEELIPSPRTEDGRAPLLISLLSSEIGTFRFRIPWKRLVWGAGDVKLTVSDVTIVVGLESNTNCDAVFKKRESYAPLTVDDEKLLELREEKQEQLRDAERRMLQGLSIGRALEKKVQPKREQEEYVEEENKTVGRLDRWLKSATSSFLWRFFAGLEAEIRNVRIVVLQDGVEVGVIVHSIEGGSADEKSGSVGSESAEDEIDAGDRQVDKKVKLQGLGAFIRLEDSKRQRFPREISFSTSVTADDYVLRPTEADIFFSIFYPSLRKASTNDAVDDAETVKTAQTTTSSRVRRGKRDRSVASRHSSSDSKTSDAPLAKKSNRGPSPSIVSSTGPSVQAAKPPSTDGKASDAPQTEKANHGPRLSIVSSTGLSVQTQPLLFSDTISAAGSRVTSASRAVRRVEEKSNPHFDFSLHFGDLKTVCSSRHLHLTHTFLAANARIRNGRPNQTISSQLGGDAAHVTRSVMVEAPDEVGEGTPLPPRSTGQTEEDHPMLKLRLLQPVKHPERSFWVRSWWKYAYANVIWSLRDRTRQREQFQPGFEIFDWKKQSHLRKEYVNLYISVKLEHRAFRTRLTYNSEGEERLLQMEDELPVEQILLYRSIARALGIRGLREMPDSITELRVDANEGNSLLEVLANATRKIKDDLHITSDRTLKRRLSTFSSGVFASSGDDDSETGEKENQYLTPIQKRADQARQRRDPNRRPRAHREIINEQAHQPEEHDLLVADCKMTSSQNMAVPAENGLDSIEIPDVVRDLSHATVKFAQHGDHDAKTVRTFKTAKTNHTKKTRESIEGPEYVENQHNVIRFSCSLKFKSFELTAYDQDFEMAQSDSSQSAQQEDHTDDDVSLFESDDDDVSELSVFSADPKYVEPDGENEQDAEDNIMSATDFLLFGMPTSIFRLCLADITFLVNGHNEGGLNAFASMRHIEITGAACCHLLSSMPVGDESRDESSTKAVPDVLEEECSTDDESKTSTFPQRKSHDQELAAPDKAIAVFIQELDDGGKSIQCDVAKVTTTLDIGAILQLNSFWSTNVLYPRSVVPDEGMGVIRSYVLSRVSLPLLKPHDEGLTFALRLHGTEVVVPMVQTGEGQSFVGTEDKSAEASEANVRLCLSSRLFECYSGRFVDYLQSAYHEEDMYLSALEQAKSDDRRLQMLDIEEMRAHQQLLPKRNYVFSLSGIDCNVESAANCGLSLVGKKSLLEQEVDAEILLATPIGLDLDDDSPRMEVLLQVSPLLCVLSKARIEALSACVFSVAKSIRASSNGNTSNREKTVPRNQLPRIEALAGNVLQSVDATFDKVNVYVVDDALEWTILSVLQKEIVMEEIISDFLSYVSCFDLHFPVEQAVLSAKQICLDRLSSLGMTAQESDACADLAQKHLIADVEMMRMSQSQALMEMSDNGGQLHFSSTSHESILDGDTNRSLASGGSLSDDDTEESLDIIDTTIRNAVERTMREYFPIVEARHDEWKKEPAVLVFDLQGVNVSVTNLFYDLCVTVKIHSVVVRNKVGMLLLRVGNEPNSEEVHSPGSASGKDSFDTNSLKAVDSNSLGSRSGANRHGFQFTEDPAICFVRFELDSECEFGSGGLPLNVLAMEENYAEGTLVHERERLDDIFIGKVAVFFSQIVAREIVQILSELSKASFPHQNERNEEVATVEEAQEPVLMSSVCGEARAFSLLLASDELAPFSLVSLSGVSFTNRQEIRLVSENFTILNLSPAGQTHHEFISQPEPRQDRESIDCDVLKIVYTPKEDEWQGTSVLSLTLSASHVLVARQHVNELIQFFLSTDYGVGKLRASFGQDEVLDSDGNPPPPLHYRVTMEDSVFIFPRSSISSEMVALKVGSLLIFNSCQSESWSLPTASSSFVCGNQVWPQTSQEGESPPQESASQGAEDRPLPEESEFHDCEEPMKSQLQMNAEEKAGLMSAFDKSWIRRISLQGKKCRFFTSTVSKAFRGENEKPRFKSFFAVGKVDDKALVYVPRRKADQSFEITLDDDIADRKQRKWEEISTHAIDLEILADMAPRVRILISDCVPILEDAESHMVPFGLQMRMSQYALLLSIWYANMQEMPIMFPFSDTAIREGATAKTPPANFPAYGSESYVRWIKDLSDVTSEISIKFQRLELSCSFDDSGYFSEDPATLPVMSGLLREHDQMKRQSLTITMQECVFCVMNDKHGIMRLACGSSYFSVHDSRKEDAFSGVLAAGEDLSKSSEYDKLVDSHSWADLSWGLNTDERALTEGLPLPFQASVHMTPGWCLINLGVEGADAVMFDFSPIFVLLDYFGSYFSSPAFGNPTFDALDRVEKLKSGRRMDSSLTAENSYVDNDTSCDQKMKIDFRLWLLHPNLTVPSSQLEKAVPCVHLDSDTGLWFNYQTIGTFSSQEVGSTNLSLAVGDEFTAPPERRKMRAKAMPDNKVKSLVKGLSVGLRIENNAKYNHTNYSLRIPFRHHESGSANSACGITSPAIEVAPIVLPSPTILRPIVEPGRFIGSNSVCELTMELALFPIASKLLQNLANGASGDNQESAEGETSDQSDNNERTFTICSQVKGVRLFVLDPVLGMHLPVAAVSLASICLTASRLGSSAPPPEQITSNAPPENLQVVVSVHLWADYFKLGLTRSWEPLLEPYQCELLYERSRARGHGFSLDADSPLHLNITGALLVTLDETINSLKRSVAEAFGDESFVEVSNATKPSRSLLSMQSSFRNEDAAITEISATGANQFVVVHKIPKPLKYGERVAFSFLNLTGQRIRIHEPAIEESGVPGATMTYLEHKQSTLLSLKATISVFENLKVVEVPYPGLSESTARGGSEPSRKHAVDVQVPGFKWLKGLAVDTSGRRFDDLVPRFPDLLLKAHADWRIKHALKLLTEVGLENGGRLISVRSPFEIRNNTSHSIALTCHPDPRHNPDSSVMRDPRSSPAPSETIYAATEGGHFERIPPGDSYQIPTLLLESALHLKGSHLGSLWIRPDDKDSLCDAFMGTPLAYSKVPIASYSSRPVQLAKLVHESSLIFSSAYGQDVASERARSGIQLSCPVSELAKSDSFAPLCYVVEIRRSPLVADRESKKRENERSDRDAIVDDGQGKRVRAIESSRSFVHRPVAYSLLIHPPLVIENLLPEGGRFELMHASRRSVLWFADLKPGERVPVHTVGLDAPLLLLVNLGFCRTPVGEGALVHHGSLSARGFLGSPQRVGLKTIGKAVTKGTKQVGKTITEIIDSPDKRGQGKLFMVQNPQFHRGKKQSQVRRRRDLRESTGMGLDTGFKSGNGARGKVHRVESQVYSPADVASETTVVDSVGQRLTLGIENVRGGGGQRRISLFCPFWIVNTTEHSLRYKQEKGTSFVSGTVLSASQDGSKPVDGSNRNYISQHKKSESIRHLKPDAPVGAISERGTIFAGTPGALATSLGRCDLEVASLARLLEKDLPLTKLAQMAFMFNFHDDVISIGHQRLSVQLGDADSRYTSRWSAGFSMDSVGVTQIVGMNCKDGRALELSVTISVAPEALSRYTKVVRFSPRYVLVNQLERPLRLWQDSSLFTSGYHTSTSIVSGVTESNAVRKWYIGRSNDQMEKVNQYESLFGRPATLDDADSSLIPVGTTANPSALYLTTLEASGLIPFHLADTRAERQLRIDLGHPWNLTSSFSSDITGEYTLKPTKSLDLRLINHVSTRAAPQYNVVLPPPIENEEKNEIWDGELGVWFETDWGGDNKIIVKGTKRGRYSFNHTDIHVGDELLLIDGEEVAGMTFADAMRLLKERITQVAARQMSLREKTDMSRSWRRRSTRILRSISAESGHAEASESVLTLTFRTVEERLRRLRLKASRAYQWSTVDGSAKTLKDSVSDPSSSFRKRNRRDNETQLTPNDDEETRSPELKVDMRNLHHSIFLFVRNQDQTTPPFRIENRAMQNVIYFRQRGCDWHSWNSLKPGESQSYTWEEPMRQKKLSVRVGVAELSVINTNDATNERADSEMKNEGGPRGSRAIHRRQLLSVQYVDSEEFGGFGPTKTVKLEEIGSKDILPCPGDNFGAGHLVLSDDCLHCHVDTDGATRVLVISDNAAEVEAGQEEHTVLERHLETLEGKIKEERKKCESLQRLKLIHGISRENFIGTSGHHLSESEDGADVPSGSLDDLQGIENIPHDDSIEDQALEIAELPEEMFLSKRNQLVIEILEATGLNPSDYSGLCNPYCEVSFKERSRSGRRAFRENTVSKQTYYIEKTVSPKWFRQKFVFDVPSDAVNVTRGHAIRLRVRNFSSVGYHRDLGQTSVHLRNLRNQRLLTGWYPLVGRSGGNELDDSSNWGRGSVKVRVQWVYTLSGLLDYFIQISESNLSLLQRSQDGMRQQLVKASEADRRKKRSKRYSISRLPNLLGLSKSMGKNAAHDEDGTPNVPKWNILRKSLIVGSDSSQRSFSETNQNRYPNRPRRQTLRLSNAQFLFRLHAQTAQSKRIRRSRIDEQGGLLQKSLLDSSLPLDDIRESISVSHDANSTSDDSLDLEDLEASSGDQVRKDLLGSQAMISMQMSGRSRGRAVSDWGIQSGSSRQNDLRRRVRTLSLTDLPENSDHLDVNPLQFLDGSPFGGDSKKALEQESDSDDKLELGSLEQLALQESENETRRLDAIDSLFTRGVVYHKGGSYFHHRHLPYHFRESLLTGTSESSEFKARSPCTATLWLRDLKSWNAAKVVMNDRDLALELSDSRAGNGSSIPRTFRNQNDGVDTVESVDTTMAKLLVPPVAAPSIVAQAIQRAEDIRTSRNRFEKACRRSLRSILNPGGWLTIRPITALNLPDTFTGMSVKVRYGNEVLTSLTADAKVTPTWAYDDDVPLTPRAGAGVGQTIRRRVARRRGDDEPLVPDQFKFDDNDLPIHVEPLQTSGTVRISVIGERINFKGEVGVLHLPLGAAIGSCIESMDDFNDPGQSISSEVSSPYYVRWFPLMSPKDSTPVEGDMGRSSRPQEGEKLRDNMFSQYFTPCIKLALIWQPDEDNNDVDGDAAIDVDQKPEISTRNLDDISSSATTHNYFNADIGRISAALIDSQRAKELLSVSLSDIDVRFSVTQLKTRSLVAVGSVQVDHQDDNAREPVVLAPTPVSHPQPTLQFIAVKDNLRSKSHVDSYNYIAFAVQELDLTVEESWMFDLWEFFISVIRRREVRKKEQGRRASVSRKPFAPASVTFEPRELDMRVDRAHQSILDLVVNKTIDTESSHFERKMYVEQLLLGLVKVNLTYMKGGKKGAYEVDERGTWTVREDMKDALHNMTDDKRETSVVIGDSQENSELFLRWSENTHDEEVWAERESNVNPSYNLPNIIAAAFPSVSDARVRLQGKQLEHVFETQGEIIASIQNYYVNETLRQIYKIVGSLDFVGNPSMLVNSFVAGVRDFIVVPSKEFFRHPRSPHRLGIGFAKGSLSLVSHSASGLFGFSSKVSATIGQAAATLSLDDSYKEWHSEMVVTQAKGLDRRWRKRGGKSARAIAMKPIEDIAVGIIAGTSGIFVSPYKGFIKGGGPGFCKGVVVGGLGLVIKPVVGVFDAISHATGSIHDIAKSVNVLEKRYQPARRLRLPYIFGLKNVLLPYDPIAARSLTLLKRYPLRGKRAKSDDSEIHVASEVLQMEPGIVTFVIVTTCRILLVKVKKVNSGLLSPALIWQVPFSKRSAVSSSVQDEGHNGVALTITKRLRPQSNEMVMTAKRTPDPNLTPESDSSTLDRQTSDYSIQERHLGSQSTNRDWESMHDEHEEPSNDPNLYGAAQSRKGDILEWYRVLGEFQHRRQLSRLHNAICCVCGDLDSIIMDIGLNADNTQQGYTAFGKMHFSKENEAHIDKQKNTAEMEVFVSLESVPWLHTIILKETNAVVDREKALVESRKSWLFSNELEVAAEEGGPDWLVRARARATFVAPEPPPLPENLTENDAVVTDILHQLERGNISYNQANELVLSHAAAVSRELDSGFLAVPVGLEDVFHSARMHDSTCSENPLSSSGDIFQSSRESFTSVISLRRKHLDSKSPLTAEDDVSKNSESTSNSQQAEDVKINELERIEETFSSSTEGGIHSNITDASGEEPSESPASLLEDKSVTESDDSDRLIFLSAHSHDSGGRSHSFARSSITMHANKGGEDPADSRLDRVESMLEQLLLLNRRQTGSVPQRNNEDPDTASLRRDVAELQKQIVEQRNYYQEALATAALRQEVADLRREAAGHKGGGYGNADKETLRKEVNDVRAKFQSDRAGENHELPSVAKQPSYRTSPRARLVSILSQSTPRESTLGLDISEESEDDTAGSVIDQEVSEHNSETPDALRENPDKISSSTLRSSFRDSSAPRRKNGEKRVLFANEPIVGKLFRLKRKENKSNNLNK